MMNAKFISGVLFIGLVVSSISFSSSFLWGSLARQPVGSLARETYSGVVVVAQTSPQTSDFLVLESSTPEAPSGGGLLSKIGLASPRSVEISHLFSPYMWNDEFIVVSRAWKYAADCARKAGIQVELICAVLPADQKACPSWARLILLDTPMENYRTGRNPVPTYGEMFTVLRNQALGKVVMYSNADIATVPDFYIKAWALMNEDLRSVAYQKAKLLEARSKYYSVCRRMSVHGSLDSKAAARSEQLCARDAIVYFENNGGRPPHAIPPMMQFFRNKSMTVDEAYALSYDPARPDVRVRGNAMTITRRQLTHANATVLKTTLFERDGSTVRWDVLNTLFAQGDHHPGNDVFLMQRQFIPRWLTNTPFIHLRPSGFLIGQYLKDHPHFVWRRIMSTPEQMLTFHIGKGTDEWPVRCQLQPRQVLFEVAHFFTRTNSTRESFWPPHHCQDANHYREYGTGDYCGKLPGDFCRGYVRLACTKYWHHGSRDRHALNTICYRVSGKGRTLEWPMCEFCNVGVLVGLV